MKRYKYRIKLHDSGYSSTRKENWREIVAWCENTFDKAYYTCDIKMSGNRVDIVRLKFKRKEDYTQLILAWC